MLISWPYKHSVAVTETTIGAFIIGWWVLCNGKRPLPPLQVEFVTMKMMMTMMSHEPRHVVIPSYRVASWDTPSARACSRKAARKNPSRQRGALGKPLIDTPTSPARFNTCAPIIYMEYRVYVDGIFIKLQAELAGSISENRFKNGISLIQNQSHVENKLLKQIAFQMGRKYVKLKSFIPRMCEIF